jgi:YlmC/YmxH family sporulation protein
MVCRFMSLKRREVVNIKDGTKYGCVNDIIVDTKTACVTAIVVYGRPRIFGLFGRGDDCVIRWDEIQMIGDDIILVDCKATVERHRRKSFWSSFFTDD